MAKLTPTQRQYVRKRTKVVELDPSEMSSELNIIPFLDIVVNLIIFLLATVAYMIPTVQLDSQLPELGRKKTGGSGPETALNLNLTIVEQGIIVAGSAGKLAQGCTTTKTGRVITVPKRNQEYDWDGLTDCLKRVKAEFSDEMQATLTADPLIHYEHVIAAMDAIRGAPELDPEGEIVRDAQKQVVYTLFPKILLSAGVR